MKCQILFSGKNKKNIINLSSVENAQRVVKVKRNVDSSLENPVLSFQSSAQSEGRQIFACQSYFSCRCIHSPKLGPHQCVTKSDFNLPTTCLFNVSYEKK